MVTRSRTCSFEFIRYHSRSVLSCDCEMKNECVLRSTINLDFYQFALFSDLLRKNNKEVQDGGYIIVADLMTS